MGELGFLVVGGGSGWGRWGDWEGVGRGNGIGWDVDVEVEVEVEGGAMRGIFLGVGIWD